VTLGMAEGGEFAQVKQRLFETLRAALQSEAAVSEHVEAVKADTPSDKASKEVLELVMRMFMEELLTTAKATGETVEGIGIPRLLDLAIALASAEVAESNTPFALLEDLFDTQVISDAERLFGLIEKRAAALAPFLTPQQKYQRGKLTLIRTSNELLRRLSKSKNTNFCGRILLFMAYVLPLAEKSGLNLKGVSAASHVEYEASEPADGMDAEGLDAPAEIPAREEGGEAMGGTTVDFSFYSTFWKLQKAFSEPVKAMASEQWASLVVQLESVLQVFGAFAQHGEGGEGDASVGEGASTEVGEGAAMEVDEAEALQEVYFAMFLTSSKLINLQLRDPYFRRHVIVQMLIFLQTISTERKIAPLLKESHRIQIEKLQVRCNELLRGIPPAGAKFAAAIGAVLQREEHWIEWKRTGCAAFDKAAALSAPTTGQKRRGGGGGKASKRMQLGNNELTRLWNMGGNSLDAISQAKQSTPALAEYLKPVQEQMDPEAGIEEEYKLKNDKAFTWKALRLMGKKDVSLLGKVSQPNGSLEAAVSYMFEKIKGTAAAEKEETGL